MNSNHFSFVLVTLIAVSFALPTVAAEKKAKKKQPSIGYTNTPILPGQKWRVHDANRPRPKWVDPGKSSTLGMKPSKGATVLFDGSNFDNWQVRGKAPTWKLENGYMEAVKKAGSITTKQPLGDMYIHLEFATPGKVEGSSQGRGNSGVIIMGKYEIQVLDSYKNPSYADGQCAAIYGQFPPLVNASLPPGEWQTYDIWFQAPKWDKDGELISPAISTVIHNGIKVHDKQAHIGQVSHKRVGRYFQPHPAKLPLTLQDHGNPIRYRNIWFRPLRDSERVKPEDANDIRPEDRAADAESGK